MKYQSLDELKDEAIQEEKMICAWRPLVRPPSWPAGMWTVDIKAVPLIWSVTTGVDKECHKILIYASGRVVGL